MRKQRSNLEWHIAESDAEWERLYVPPPLSHLTPGANQHSLLERSFWNMGALLLLLVGIGYWAWRTEQARVRHADAQMTVADLYPVGVSWLESTRGVRYLVESPPATHAPHATRRAGGLPCARGTMEHDKPGDLSRSNGSIGNADRVCCNHLWPRAVAGAGGGLGPL